MSKLVQYKTSELANALYNCGRPSGVTYNADLAQSVFQTNKTRNETLTVVAIKADQRKQYVERTQSLLDSLDLGEKNQAIIVESLEVADGEEEKRKLWKVKKEELILPVDSKIKASVFAGNHRLIHFIIKLLVTGVDEVLWCQVVDTEEEAIEISESENLIKNVGVTKLTDLDTYTICYNMIKRGRIAREVDFGKATGLKRTRCQKVFGLAIKAQNEKAFHAEIMEGRIQVGESFCTIKQLPNGIGSKIKACRDMGEIRQKLEESVTLNEAEKVKAIGRGDIQELLITRSSGPVHDLLNAILSGDTDKALTAVLEASKPFAN